MNAPYLSFIAVACLAIHARGEAKNRIFDAVTTTDGLILKKVEILNSDDNTVKLSHSNGVGSFRWDQFSKIQQLQLGYDQEEIDKRNQDEKAKEIAVQTEKLKKHVEDLYAPKPGLFNTLQIDYKNIHFRTSPTGEDESWDGGGSVSMSVLSKDELSLRFINNNRPSAIPYNSKYVSVSYLELAEKDVEPLLNMLKKFFDWKEEADRHDLKNIHKKMGRFNNYGFTFYRSKHGISSCSVSSPLLLKNDITDEDFKSIAKFKLTIYPETALCVASLLKERNALRAKLTEKDIQNEKNQKRADSILE